MLHWITVEDVALETVVSVATYADRAPSAAASRLATFAAAG